MEIFHAFGIDWRLLIIQAVNFGLLLLVLHYFLYQPLIRLLDERRTKIERGVQDAERAADTLAKAEHERRSVVTAAAKEAENVIERARKEIVVKEKQAIAEAEENAARILAAAEKESEELRVRALAGAKEEMARLVVLGVEKVLRKN